MTKKEKEEIIKKYREKNNKKHQSSTSCMMDENCIRSVVNFSFYIVICVFLFVMGNKLVTYING